MLFLLAFLGFFQISVSLLPFVTSRLKPIRSFPANFLWFLRGSLDFLESNTCRDYYLQSDGCVNVVFISAGASTKQAAWKLRSQS